MASKIIVEGFKSIGDRVEVEIRPLTLLAGANSSGKSSLMQAILLLKQTIEVNYDPGTLLLNGPNVKVASLDQILHFGSNGKSATTFTVGFQFGEHRYFETCIARGGQQGNCYVERCIVQDVDGTSLQLSLDTDPTEFFDGGLEGTDVREVGKELRQNRFWLEVAAEFELRSPLHYWWDSLTKAPVSSLNELIHIPGIRGNPERTYPVTSSGPNYPGTFECYTASVVARWSSSDKPKLNLLGRQLQLLGLTWKVDARKVDDASIELRVGRLVSPIRGGTRDLISIADVGRGISHVLPILVSLLEARPGQLVYIEQPEVHLHPKAQVAMAGLLADAAKRGVELVVETHSSLLLLAVQTLVAQGDLDSDLVKLHWFTRDEKSGATKITSADLDQAGRFGDWPEDFDDVSLMAQSQYLDAVEAAVAKE